MPQVTFPTQRDAAGRPVASYAGVPIVDLGAKAGTNNPVIATTTGKTDIYVIIAFTCRFPRCRPNGQQPHQPPSELPTTSRGSRRCCGEMVATVALKKHEMPRFSVV